MRSFYLGIAVALFSTLSTCENALYQDKLNKPTLYPDGINIFDPEAGLEKGLKEHLPSMGGSRDLWKTAYIPKTCTKPNSHKYPLQLKNIQVWNFHYDDVRL